MGNYTDFLVLIQSIARICMLFGVYVTWCEYVYRIVTLIICVFRIAAYYRKRANKKTSLAKTSESNNTD